MCSRSNFDWEPDVSRPLGTMRMPGMGFPWSRLFNNVSGLERSGILDAGTCDYDYGYGVRQFHACHRDKGHFTTGAWIGCTDSVLLSFVQRSPMRIPWILKRNLLLLADKFSKIQGTSKYSLALSKCGDFFRVEEFLSTDRLLEIVKNYPC